jgi:hypothetical protein
MKLYREISFRIIFLIAVLFCFGVNTYSYSTIQTTNFSELTANTNNVLNYLSSDIDPFGDDQINHINEFSSVVDLSYQIPILQNYFLITNISFSIWQPPKIS